MTHDIELIEQSVLSTDPSFRAVNQDALDRHLNEARQLAQATSKDALLLSLMQLLSLPGNGHTRLIPNDAISVLPLRFVSIGQKVRLLDAPPSFASATGGELVAINDAPLHQIEDAAQKYLAGTRQRRRVIGSILFAWPHALVSLGVYSGSGPINYRIRNESGQTSSLSLDTAQTVTGSAFYPRNEHGKADASWVPNTFLDIKDFGNLGLLLVLPSFYDPSGKELSHEIARAQDVLMSLPNAPLLIDVRGNTGGNFLLTLPLIDAVLEGSDDRQVGVIVDKYTFSAAIVFVAILKDRLGTRLQVIGEEMGDGLTFFAEGGTIDLPTSGAAVRYSSAFHDWAEGRFDETTPREISDKLVSVGKIPIDLDWTARAEDVELRDQFCRNFLASLQT